MPARDATLIFNCSAKWMQAQKRSEAPAQLRAGAISSRQPGLRFLGYDIRRGALHKAGDEARHPRCSLGRPIVAPPSLTQRAAHRLYRMRSKANVVRAAITHCLLAER